jgi:Tfp pilus assembly protein PilF
MTSRVFRARYSAHFFRARYSAHFLAVASGFLAALVLGGCATAAAPQRPPEEPAQERAAAEAAAVDAALARALRLVEIASPASMAEAERVLASDPLKGAGAGPAAGIATRGSALFELLYPEADSPFPAGAAAASTEGEVSSDFLTLATPALALLDAREMRGVPRRAAGADKSQAASFAAALAKADDLNPESVLPPYLEALLAERQSDGTPAARALYEECLRRAPSFYPAASAIARIIIDAGAVPGDLPRLEQLASLLPTAPLRFEALARAALAAGAPEGAADAAAQGLLVAPEDPRFALLRAQAFESLGDWYQALRILDALLKLAPDLPAAILMKARLLHESAANDAEALRILLDAEVRFPSYPELPEMRGGILLDEGQADEGVAALTAALALQPDRVSTLTLLLKEEVRTLQWSEASALLDRIPERELTPAHLRIGWQVATGLGDHEKSLAYARSLVAKAGSAESFALEARSLLAAGRPAEALPAVDRGLSLAGSPEVRSELYAIRAAAGSDDPLRDLRSALRDNPDNVEALAAITGLLAGQTEYRKALEYAKRAAALSPGNVELEGKIADLQALADTGE